MMSKTTIAIGILASLLIGVTIGVFSMAGQIGHLKSEIEIQHGEREYIVEKGNRDARMLNAKSEMLDFVSTNLDTLMDMLDTYRQTVYDMSIKLREQEAE